MGERISTAVIESLVGESSDLDPRVPDLVDGGGEGDLDGLEGVNLLEEGDQPPAAVVPPRRSPRTIATSGRKVRCRPSCQVTTRTSSPICAT